MDKTPLKATDPCDLERLIMDSNIAKSPPAWWAKRGIESLRTQIAELKAENERLKGFNVELTAKCNWYNRDGARLEAERDEFKARYERLKPRHEAYVKMIGELLAVLHADGGHYQYEHGTEKAVEDAITKHYELTRQLAEYKADAAPEGYVFLSADFSRQAAGRSQFGTVTFIRNKVGRQWWHELPEEQQEITSLHIYGKGTTVIEAMRHAAMEGDKR